MKWYIFRQNNTGGKFVGPKVVCVQAFSASQANHIAQMNSVYFDAKDEDCIDCCGYRWYKAEPGDGEDEPTYYGRPLDPEDLIVYLSEPNDILKENL